MAMYLAMVYMLQVIFPKKQVGKAVFNKRQERLGGGIQVDGQQNPRQARFQAA